MRKLSEITGADGIKVVGEALPVIEKLVKSVKKKDGETTIEFVGEMLKANPDETLKLMAIIDGVPAETYESKTLFEILKSVTEMINDPELMSLFS